MSKKQKRLREPLSEEGIFVSGQALREALKNGSDLACVLIAGAAIENALMVLLENFLVDCPESKNLFDIKNELDSFSSCNKMAFCLGLTCRESFENIKKLGVIRNKVAHSHVPIDFSNNDIIGLCNELAFHALSPKEREGIEKHATTPRNKFHIIVNLEWGNIMCVAALAKNPGTRDYRRQEFKWAGLLSESALLLLKNLRS